MHKSVAQTRWFKFRIPQDPWPSQMIYSHLCSLLLLICHHARCCTTIVIIRWFYSSDHKYRATLLLRLIVPASQPLVQLFTAAILQTEICFRSVWTLRTGMFANYHINSLLTLWLRQWKLWVVQKIINLNFSFYGSVPLFSTDCSKYLHEAYCKVCN